jgi:aldose 1-epimerase
LPIDEVELGNAIHGLVRWAEWIVEDRTADSVRLGYHLAARPGYPFPLDCFVTYRLTRSGLTVAVGADNVGSAPCPFGAGAHPYFAFGSALVDDIELSVPAAEWIAVDARSLPVGRRRVEGSAVDFRRPRRVGPTLLDHAFTGLDRDSEGLAHVLLRHQNEEIDIWLDPAFGFVQVFTGDTLSDLGRRRFSVAVEPTSCAPNAFNTGDGLVVLEPGLAFEGRWGVTVE